MNAFWEPVPVELPTVDIHQSPLRGPQCCTQYRTEMDKNGKISMMRFFHVHCRKHAWNCAYCPDMRIAPGQSRNVPIRAAAAKALLLLQEQGEGLEDD